MTKSLWRYIQPSSPLRDGHSAPIKGDSMITAPIVALLFLCRPTTVLGRVRAVVVDTIKRVPRWARPHVGVEVCKRVAPAVADLDAPPAIVSVVRMLRVQAPRFHGHPRPVFACADAVDMSAVCSVSDASHLADLFSVEASARRGDACHQRLNEHRVLGAAIAPAHDATTREAFGWPDDDPAPEPRTVRKLDCAQTLNYLTDLVMHKRHIGGTLAIAG